MSGFVAWVTAIDFTVLDWIAAHLANPILDAILISVTLLGDWCIPWLAFAIGLLCHRKYRKWGILLLLALACEIVCTDVLLKTIFSRPRPFTVHPQVTLLIEAPGSYSFPSGHAGSAFACAVSLCLTKRARLWVPGMILAVLTAFSRIYLYVHYPSDVLAGALIGVGCALMVYRLILPYFPKKEYK